MNAIEIRGLRKTFERFHLGPLNLTVPEGAIYGLIGPNGAGKTTTLDLILGMGRKEAGSITVLGLDHQADEAAMKRLVGYVSPDLNYLAWGRVGGAIQFIRGFYETWDATYCQRLLQEFRLDGEEKIATLSFGAKIKLNLALALSWRPRVLILDEPTVGLDAITRQQVFRELLAVVREGDRTVLISSHSLSELERFTDHIGLIKNGMMLLEGTTSEVVGAFRMVDFMTRENVDLARMEGCYVQKREDNRWRVLLDTRRQPLASLEAKGIHQLSTAPVSLEDLFVALAKE